MGPAGLARPRSASDRSRRNALRGSMYRRRRSSEIIFLHAVTYALILVGGLVTQYAPSRSRKARTLRAVTRGDYGDALAARLAAAGARAAQARRRGRPAVTPERLREMMRIVQDQRRAAALVRSPSPRKTPHKFRGSTIYPPPHVEVPVPTSPGF